MNLRTLLLRRIPCFGLLLAAPVLCQESPRIFTETVDVRVIDLEVVVTDRDGDRVHGLEPGDFRLLVDGEETPIDYFSEIRSSRLVPAEPTASQADAPKPAVASREDEMVPRNLVVFIDDSFGIAPQRNEVLSGLRETVADLRPADRMAIVSFDGRELRLLTDWTGSRDEILRALEAASEAPAHGLEKLAELGRYDRFVELELDPSAQSTQSFGGGGGGAGGGDADPFDRGRIDDSLRMQLQDSLERLTRQVEAVVRATTMTVRTFGDAPGRTVMIALSGGWPREPLLYVRGSDPGIRELDLRSYDLRIARALDDLTATANLVGTTLYTVDLPQRQPGGVSAESRGVADLPSGAEGAPLPALTGARELMRESSLVEIAKETGGEAYLNARALEALSATLTDTSSYYWLGFTPNRQRDDELHEVRVEVLRPGAEVRVRKGFRDLSRSREVDMAVESQLLFSDATGEGLAVRIHEPRAKRRRLEVPLSLVIPMDRVVMVPTARGYEAQLELRVAVQAENGDRSEMPVIPIELVGPEPPADGAHALYDTTLRLRNQKQKIVLALVDVHGDDLLSTSFELDPAGF